MNFEYQDKKLVRTVLTANRGVILDSELNIGDFLIEFNTFRLIPVTGIERRQYSNIYRVKYIDGREEYYTDKELLYTPRFLFHPYDLMYKDTGWDCSPTVVKYPVSPDNSILDVPPYVAGALWAYGDFTYPYINLPLDRVNANPSILYNMNCEMFETKDGLVFFKKKGTYPEEPLWWKDLFKYNTWYEDHIDDPSIPYKYAYGSLDTRLRFIRGIFDYGYDSRITPDHVSIMHWSKDRLKQVQWLLWSFGVMSHMETESDKYYHKYPYRLEIIDKWNNKPVYFNNIDFVEWIVNSDNRVQRMQERPKLRIVDVCEVGPYEYELNGYTPVIYTSNEHDVYYSGQFLPRVTE